MTLAVICAMGRDDGANLRANWERQRHRGAALIVVENGPGIGSCARHGVAATALQSAQHQSHARNAGIDFAIAQDFTRWANWDSDDWYGAENLSEVVAAFEAGHELIGKSDHFCELSGGRLVLLGADGENRETQALQGPTLASLLWPDMPRFPIVDIGEDIDWTAAMVAAGLRPWATSRNHFCYSRRGEPATHACDVTDAELLYFRAGTVRVVHCESRLAVLNGTEAPQLALHVPEPCPVWDHPQNRKRGPRSETRPQTRGNFWPSDVFDPSNFDAGVGV